MNKVALDVPLPPKHSKASVKWPPKTNNGSKIIMEFDHDVCKEYEKQWVDTNDVFKQKGMLVV